MEMISCVRKGIPIGCSLDLHPFSTASVVKNKNKIKENEEDASNVQLLSS